MSSFDVTVIMTLLLIHGRLPLVNRHYSENISFNFIFCVQLDLSCFTALLKEWELKPDLYHFEMENVNCSP